MKKRLLSLALAFVLAFSLLPTAAFAAEEPKLQGSGTEADPYLIGTAAELEWFRDLVNRSNDTDNHRDACAKLTENITLTGEWTPISNKSAIASAYSGTFDGDKHTISGLSGSNGLFGFVNGATIKNLKVEGTISGASANVGGIVGKTQTGTKIENCAFTGSVSSTSTGNTAGVGGIVGKVNTGSLTITNCYNTANVTSSKNAGGILGYSGAAGTKIENCFNTGTISGTYASGGIVGSMTSSKSSISNCYWTRPDAGRGLGSGKINNDGKVDSISAGTLGDAFTTDASDNVILKWEAGSEVKKDPHITISGTKTMNQTNDGSKQSTTLEAKQVDIDNVQDVEWTIESGADVIELESPAGANEHNSSIIVKELQPGLATIRATAGDYTATADIRIVPYISALQLDGTPAAGEKYKVTVYILNAKLYDEEKYGKLTGFKWTYSDNYYDTSTATPISGDGMEITVPADTEGKHLSVSLYTHRENMIPNSIGGYYKVIADSNSAALANDKTDLTIPTEDIKAPTTLELPLTGKRGSAIAWTSSDTDIISDTGVVTLPQETTTVTLTATLTYNGKTEIKTFTIKVWSQAEVEAEANDKVLQLNNAIDAAKLNTLSPTYGKDTNVLTMVETKLNNPDISVSIKGVEKANATDNSSNIADNGDVTFFYANPNNAPLQRFGTYSVTFTFTRDGITAERTIPVVVYWDQTQVKSAMTAEILDKVTVDEEATVTANFDLPKVVDGKKWTLISWQSSDPAITISTKKQTTADTLFDPYVAVVRGGSAEKKVTLTANFTFQLANSSDETSALTLHKTFTVNVAPSADGEKYQDALNTVFDDDSLKDITGDGITSADGVYSVSGDIQFPITGDLNRYMLDKYGEGNGFDGKYTPVLITSSDPSVIKAPDVANAARVAVYRPAVGQGEETVTLTVKILDRPSGEGRDYAKMPVLAEKRFTVTVQPLTEAEITNELALMAEVKAHYWDGIKNDNDAAGDVTGDLAPFVEVYKQDGALVWVRDVKEMKNSGIVPVAMDGWQDLEAWRLFRSSNPAAVTHENLLVTQQFEGKAVTVTSALSSETLGRYGELYRNDPETYADYAACDGLYYQPVRAELVVRGRNTAHMVKIMVNGGTETRLVSKAVEEKVTVSFTLSGNGELWLGTRMIRDLDEGVTVFDVLRQLRDESVLSFVHKGGYVQSITCGGKTLAELDEGKNSGWLYTVNGELPDVYMSAYGLKNGDSVRVYFTKDYTKEPGADRWKPVTPVTKTETVTNADGSVTKIETKPDGTVIETTTWRDGSTLTAETSPDGRVETVEKRADGTTVETVESASGGITASVSVPKSVGSTRVDIPVSKPTGSMVAVIVHPDGTEEIVRGSVVTETGVALRVEGNVRLKIIDNAKRFNDMANHWAKDAVEFASSRELFNGVGNDAFGPDRSMTRGMVSTVLARLAGADTAGGETWYAKGTVWAVENGISDGTAPEQPVTREQLAAMLYRYAGSPAVSGELGFDDADSISAWARDAVRWCVDNGILNGVGGNRMTPQDLARRGQVAAMLMRFLQATV